MKFLLREYSLEQTLLAFFALIHSRFWLAKEKDQGWSSYPAMCSPVHRTQAFLHDQLSASQGRHWLFYISSGRGFTVEFLASQVVTAAQVVALIYGQLSASQCIDCLL